MKKFITAISLQSDLVSSSIVYNAGDNKKLMYENKTCFPIIPVIANNVNEGEEIKLVVIVTDYENAKKNVDVLKSELNNLAEAKSFAYSMTTITTSYDETIDTHIELCGKLIENIEDNDVLNACVTYGSKPMPMIMMMALNYGYQLKSNVVINSIVYGKYDHNTKTARIFDVSALFFMNSAITNLARMNLSNPLDFLKQMFEI